MGLSNSIPNAVLQQGVCTSTTRPSSPYIGQAVYETDTFSVRIWDGTAWVGTTPSGAIETFAGTAAPNGWLLCFGQAVSRTTYADLFAALSTTYGTGNGTTTFNVPDLRGRVAAGKDNMGGSSASRLVTNVAGGNLGATGGAESHTLTTAQLPFHSHQYFQNIQHTDGLVVTGEATMAGLTLGGRRRYVDNTEGSGNNVAHNNTQPTIVLNYIIKV